MSCSAVENAQSLSPQTCLKSACCGDFSMSVGVPEKEREARDRQLIENSGQKPTSQNTLLCLQLEVSVPPPLSHTFTRPLRETLSPVPAPTAVTGDGRAEAEPERIEVEPERREAESERREAEPQRREAEPERREEDSERIEVEPEGRAEKLWKLKERAWDVKAKVWREKRRAMREERLLLQERVRTWHVRRKRRWPTDAAFGMRNCDEEDRRAEESERRREDSESQREEESERQAERRSPRGEERRSPRGMSFEDFLAAYSQATNTSFVKANGNFAKSPRSFVFFKSQEESPPTQKKWHVLILLSRSDPLHA
ncbi:hypothetical protein CAPTEDRAFT_227643 [Capitella teleta]|uniref:Uncharacterized protein n=1 Tax=Capitella teleta TaxID=283909 RepID=R7T730_CAPTE|nr:hypothetical protein CAPTEDRAFT_227643 [Capitella teleta]|eukprot:ELT89208.1 hypothetical protein CAPTEDRAFT_227643 [Capitella teleta]